MVAAIFYCYMTTYYLVYHVLEIDNKWVVLFNSFFYSTTHMINPVIYFSLNKEMRAQLRQALYDLLHFICCGSVRAALKRREGYEFGYSSTMRRRDYGVSDGGVSLGVGPRGGSVSNSRAVTQR